MDLRDASFDDIAEELARRDQKFILLFLNTNKVHGSGAEMHCGNISEKQGKQLLKDASRIFNCSTSGEKLPEDVHIVKRVLKKGEVVEEVNLDNLKGELEIEPNEIGSFDPWDTNESSEETIKEPEPPKKDLSQEENKPRSENYDPWSQS